MPNLVITNLTSKSIFLRDLYIRLLENATSSPIYRTNFQIEQMTGLREYEQNRTIRIVRTFTEEERLASSATSPEFFTAKATNFSIRQDESFSDVITYVRTDGSDVTGDGSLDNPYATFCHGIESIPASNSRINNILDITGINEELRNSDFLISHFMMRGVERTDTSEFGFNYKGPVHVRAIPDLQLTIEDSDVLSTSADAITNLTRYTVDLTLVAGDYEDMFAVDDNGVSVAIVTNGTNTLDIAGGDLTFPIKIYERSATLSAPEDSDIMTISSNLDSLIFSGINFQIPSPTSSRYITTKGGTVNFIACGFNCSFFLGGNVLLNASTVLADEQVMFLGNSLITMNYNYIKGISEFFSLQGSIGAFAFSCIFEDCGTLFNASEHSDAPRTLVFQNSKIIGSLADAISLKGSTVCRITHCEIADTTGNAISANNNGNSVHMTSVKGTGNSGVGLLLINGATGRMNDNAITVTGTGGDLKVGTLAVRTWTDFRGSAPVKNQIDFTALIGDASRAYQI